MNVTLELTEKILDCSFIHFLFHPDNLPYIFNFTIFIAPITPDYHIIECMFAFDMNKIASLPIAKLDFTTGNHWTSGLLTTSLGQRQATLFMSNAHMHSIIRYKGVINGKLSERYE